jgi:hypothetical protein
MTGAYFGDSAGKTTGQKRNLICFAGNLKQSSQSGTDAAG